MLQPHPPKKAHQEMQCAAHAMRMRGLRAACAFVAFSFACRAEDPALLRSGRLDRKIELPHPNEDALCTPCVAVRGAAV